MRGLTMEIVDVRKVTIRGDEVDVTTFEGKDDKVWSCVNGHHVSCQERDWHAYDHGPCPILG